MTDQALNYSAAKLLAYAVCQLFPQTQLVGSQAGDLFFQYDFILHKPLDNSSLSMIEEQMHSLARKTPPHSILEMMRENAAAYFQHHGQEIMAAQAAHSPSNLVQVFKMGEWIDFNPDISLPITPISCFKLLSIKPAFHLIPGIGKQSTTRIEGTAHPDSYHLKKFLKKWEAAKKSQHVQLGQEMDLFTYSLDPLFCSWKPKGITLRKLLTSLAEKEFPYPLQDGDAPPLFPLELLPLKKMITPPLIAEDEAESYAVCLPPVQTLAYHDPIAEQTLPLRYRSVSPIWQPVLPQHAEGLFNTPISYYDTTQILCTEQQMESEVISLLQFINKIINMFPFKSRWVLRSCPPPFWKKKRMWDQAEELLIQALQKTGFEYSVERHSSKYDLMCNGPKIEMDLQDVLGQFRPGPSVMIDLANREHLNLQYEAPDGTRKGLSLITLHSLGALDRFIGMLLEVTAGLLPFWLAPEQVRIIPIGRKQEEWSTMIASRLAQEGFRLSVDFFSRKLGEKIHKAEVEKIPYVIVIGDQEDKRKEVTIRSRGKEEILNLSLDACVEWLKHKNRLTG